MVYKITYSKMLASSRLKLTGLIAMLLIPFLFAEGDWCLVALFRRATKRKNPTDPVNPV